MRLQSNRPIAQPKPSASASAAAKPAKIPAGLEDYRQSSQILFMSSSKSKLATGERATMTVKVPKTFTSNIPNAKNGKLYDVTYQVKSQQAKVAKNSNLVIESTKINPDGTATVVVRATKPTSVGPVKSGGLSAPSPVYIEQSGEFAKAVEFKETPPAKKTQPLF